MVIRLLSLSIVICALLPGCRESDSHANDKLMAEAAFVLDNATHLQINNAKRRIQPYADPMNDETVLAIYSFSDAFYTGGMEIAPNSGTPFDKQLDSILTHAPFYRAFNCRYKDEIDASKALISKDDALSEAESRLHMALLNYNLIQKMNREIRSSCWEFTPNTPVFTRNKTLILKTVIDDFARRNAKSIFPISSIIHINGSPVSKTDYSVIDPLNHMLIEVDLRDQDLKEMNLVEIVTTFYNNTTGEEEAILDMQYFTLSDYHNAQVWK